MDWNNTSHLLQALMVCCGVFMFVIGYRAGDKI